MAFGRIGMTAIDQALHHGDHRLDVIGRLGLQRRRNDAQRIEILAIDASELRRDGIDPLTALAGGGHDLVVDIGDIGRQHDAPGTVEISEHPAQHIEHDRRARIADMSVAVDRRTADIHRHPVLIDRFECALSPRHRIVKGERFHVLVCSVCVKGVKNSHLPCGHIIGFHAGKA